MDSKYQATRKVADKILEILDPCLKGTNGKFVTTYGLKNIEGVKEIIAIEIEDLILAK